MMKGLSNSKRLNVDHGKSGKIFAILLTAILQRPDYIHFDWVHQYYLRRTNWMTYVNYPIFIFQLLIVKYIFRIKIAWTLHNLVPHDQPFFGPYKWSRLFFAKTCNFIRVFDVNTIDNAVDLLKVKKSKFVVVPEGSYVDYYSDEMSEEQARKILSIGEHTKVLLFFGSLRPYKGIEDLIEAFLKFKKKDWLLLISGKCKDPNYLNDIKSITGKNPEIIIKPEGVKNEAIQVYMNAANIVVLPFKKIENSGSAILAMGFKKAIIAPNMGVLPSRLKAQKELLYEENLDEILKELDFNNPTHFQKIGERNFENLKAYNWQDFESSFI